MAPRSAIRFELDAGVGHIVLDSGDGRNPIHDESVVALHEAVLAARAADVGVVVLRAVGSAFSVGGDLSRFAAAADPERYIDDLAEALHRSISELTRLDAVVVSVVGGVAAGAGLPLAAAADIVLAGRSARFTLAYTRAGLSPDGGTSLLTASLGLHRALHLALINPVLSADEAQAAGLVSQVFNDADLDAGAKAVFALLASGSRSAQVRTKRLFRAQATPAAETAMRLETLGIRAQAGSPDGREGVRAFVEKRPADFPA
jgi:2-(1,2-epoxy-1,2-dihydrophenyl)acetyl-CoA isomerase